MQTQRALLFWALLLAACAEVKLENPIPEDPIDEAVLPREEVKDTPLAPSPEEYPAEVLEDLEQQIFDEVATGPVEGELPSPRVRPKSTKKCCKLGRQVAEKGLFCNIDLMQVQKRPNVIHRRKMKFHGPEVHGKTVYKDLMRRVEKCALGNASERMFVKCCEWQEDIMFELEQCKTLSTLTERRRCRRRVQSRE